MHGLPASVPLIWNPLLVQAQRTDQLLLFTVRRASLYDCFTSRARDMDVRLITGSSKGTEDRYGARAFDST